MYSEKLRLHGGKWLTRANEDDIEWWEEKSRGIGIGFDEFFRVKQEVESLGKRED